LAEPPLPRAELAVEAPGGYRILAEVAGPEDGPLLIFHNGTPGSRHVYEGHLRAAAERGLRHASYSRPGYEGSDRRADRDFAACAEESAALADALGASRFHVLGLSGGGPPALACAALLPERVLSAATFACFMPQDAGIEWTEGMAEINLREYRALQEGDEALLASIESLAAEMSGDGDESFGEALAEALCEADLAVLDGPYLEFQRVIVRRILAGGIWGWFDDDKATFRDWGFDPAEIAVPVSLWHGSEDRFVPPAHGEWLAERIPGAEPHRVPGHGHVSLFADLYPAALDALIAAAR
jgi:pimeloyl-ACP methyl ester carboxylesterase